MNSKGQFRVVFLHDSQQLGLGNKVAQRNSNSIFPEFPQNFWAFKVVMCGSAELRLGWACKFTHCFREYINKLKVELMNNMCYQLSFMFHTEPLQVYSLSHVELPFIKLWIDGPA